MFTNSVSTSAETFTTTVSSPWMTSTDWFVSPGEGRVGGRHSVSFSSVLDLGGPQAVLGCRRHHRPTMKHQRGMNGEIEGEDDRREHNQGDR
jgi:hypothetical protein